MKHKEKFAEKRHFGIPLDTFIEIQLSEKDAIKIRQWIKNHDTVAVYSEGFSNAIVLINETKLALQNQHS